MENVKTYLNNLQHQYSRPFRALFPISSTKGGEGGELRHFPPLTP